MKQFERSDKIVLISIVILVLVSLASTAWLFLYKKDYYFTIEESCNPKTENCFHRDCSDPAGCPPNGFSDYSALKVRAIDFPKCIYNSCKLKCASGEISCVKIMCGASNEDSCSQSPEPAAG
jgi:hypothetical protein